LSRLEAAVDEIGFMRESAGVNRQATSRDADAPRQQGSNSYQSGGSGGSGFQRKGRLLARYSHRLAPAY
jgi:hypothetical protein